MLVKHLLPLPVRNQLRPAYQSVRRWVRDGRQAVVECPIWPKPAAWHRSKEQMAEVTDSAQLYRIAAKEFGILQVENEIVPFLDYVAEHRPTVIGEIGLKHGGNSFMFLRKLQSVTLYLGMDLVLENTAKLRFFRRNNQRVQLLEGN